MCRAGRHSQAPVRNSSSRHGRHTLQSLRTCRTAEDSSCPARSLACLLPRLYAPGNRSTRQTCCSLLQSSRHCSQATCRNSLPDPPQGGAHPATLFAGLQERPRRYRVMKVLLTNDDGIHSRGLMALYTALRERGHGGGDHPVPSRTRQLSPPSPRVLQRQAAGGQDVALASGASILRNPLAGFSCF